MINESFSVCKPATPSLYLVKGLVGDGETKGIPNLNRPLLVDDGSALFTRVNPKRA